MLLLQTRLHWKPRRGGCLAEVSILCFDIVFLIVGRIRSRSSTTLRCMLTALRFQWPSKEPCPCQTMLALRHCATIAVEPFIRTETTVQNITPVWECFEHVMCMIICVNCMESSRHFSAQLLPALRHGRPFGELYIAAHFRCAGNMGEEGQLCRWVDVTHGMSFAI